MKHRHHAPLRNFEKLQNIRNDLNDQTQEMGATTYGIHITEKATIMEKAKEQHVTFCIRKKGE